MTEQTKETNRKGSYEIHIQTILLGVITACIIGAFQKVNEVNERLVRLEEREKVKTEQINSIQSATNKMQLDIDRIKERLTIIESKNPTK